MRNSGSTSHGGQGRPPLPIGLIDKVNADLQDDARRRDWAPPAPRRPRKTLPHTPPLWIPNGAIWFLTICCARRGGDELVRGATPRDLLGSAHFFHERARWFVYLLLLMPDHLHALVSFPPEEQMGRVVRAWKRYQATQHGILWQRDFFDHRLRDEESFDDKAQYIRMNPVRAGLVEHDRDWPYVLAFNGRDGTAVPS